jgi:hypothetical protein
VIDLAGVESVVVDEAGDDPAGLAGAAPVDGAAVLELGVVGEGVDVAEEA